jgi:hypothetical protein
VRASLQLLQLPAHLLYVWPLACIAAAALHHKACSGTEDVSKPPVKASLQPLQLLAHLRYVRPPAYIAAAALHHKECSGTAPVSEQFVRAYCNCCSCLHTCCMSGLLPASLLSKRAFPQCEGFTAAAAAAGTLAVCPVSCLHRCCLTSLPKV